ncbi:MAG: NAD(P)/FAD-dependent oxidoreductase [Gemmatimonadaceae bacterium]
MSSLDPTVDIAVVGSGFAGSLMAMIAQRLGRSVILLERGVHPRFAIGESSTPLANLLLEELARRYDLPRLLPLTKYGSWRRSYPDVACGLKRGFSFFHHKTGVPFADDARHRRQLLVGASPHDEIADTHWYRPDFDHFLVREAQAIGVEYADQVNLRTFTSSGCGGLLQGDRRGMPVRVHARLVIDATGPRGFLHRALALHERALDGLPMMQSLFTHFTDVARFEDMAADAFDTLPPFPVDAAAVHHLFDGGWIWILRFGNGITSAGVSATDAFARELRLEEGAAAWERLLLRLPSVRAQFEHARPVLGFMHLPRVSFGSGAITGPDWVMLPSAAGLIDPLLSTGFPLTLLGVGRLAEVLENYWGSLRLAERLQGYAEQTSHDLDTTARRVGARLLSLDDFESFTALALLYFAAASFAESARRLGRPELAGSAFLLDDHPRFGPAARACVARASGIRTATERDNLLADVMRAIVPVNVAGLGRPERRNWYPVYARDLLEAAEKLQADDAAIHALLQRTGFVSSSSANQRG